MDALTHEQTIDRWVREALRSAKTFADIVLALPGVYPADVLEAMRRNGVTVAEGPSEKLLVTTGPCPHPVDSDWRFHPDSEAVVVGLTERHSARNAILLGCPSLAEPLARILPLVALIDRNRTWAPHISSAIVRPVWGDVSKAPEQWASSFDLAIVDPPWYPTEIAQFLAAAAAVLRPGGHALLSWPGAGTRPSLENEWVATRLQAEKLGLRFLETRPLELRYSTPFFEGAAMRAAGIPILNGWRRADLVTFVRQDAPATKLRGQATTPWVAVRFRTLDLRVHVEGVWGEECDPRLRTLVGGDVLPSVSRRDPRRSQARVWTGGNRIFDCARPDLFCVAVSELADGTPVAASVRRAVGRDLEPLEAAWCGELEGHVRNLERLERSEYDALHETRGATERAASGS